MSFKKDVVKVSSQVHELQSFSEEKQLNMLKHLRYFVIKYKSNLNKDTSVCFKKDVVKVLYPVNEP